MVRRANVSIIRLKETGGLIPFKAIANSLNKFMLLFVQIHVVDVKCRETVDIVDVSSVDLVSSAPFFQGLATGGNVSQALVYF